jgi:hypothetical protein
MMKSFVPFVMLSFCMCPCLGSIIDDPEIADGYLTNSEYVNMGVLEGYEKLFVMGGGANRIEVRDWGYLEVQDTAKPLGYHSGIYDIMLGDNSELLYLGGITEEITIGKNAKAYLKGGRIDYITIGDHPNYSHELVIYCRAGYLMNSSGISGLWANGTSFDIEFINASAPYPPTWQGIDIVIVPEPASLILLTLGGLFLSWR